MKVTSSKPKGQRIFRADIKTELTFGRHKGRKVRRPIAINIIGSSWWFSLRTGEWLKATTQPLDALADSIQWKEMDLRISGL